MPNGEFVTVVFAVNIFLPRLSLGLSLTLCMSYLLVILSFFGCACFGGTFILSRSPILVIMDSFHLCYTDILLVLYRSRLSHFFYE